MIVYLPFVVLTLAYLALRFVMFGQAAREERLGWQGFREFVYLVDRHLARVVAGEADASRILVWMLIALVLAVCLLVARATRSDRSTTALVVFFGPVWWLLGVAPVLVAGYESPRHVYLAAVGWAILLAVAFERLYRVAPTRPWRRLAIAGGAVAMAAYAVLLYGVVREWNMLGLVSERATRGLARESRAAPQGALLIVGVPAESWEWALPFAATPPFSRTDLRPRSHIISPWALHCCRLHWFDDTRRTLAAWSGGQARDAVVLLRWDGQTAELARLSQGEQPSLPDIARSLMDVRDPHLLDLAIRRLIATVAADR